MNTRNSNSFFNIAVGTVAAVLLTCSLYLASEKPYIKQQVEIEADFYINKLQTKNVKLPANLSSTSSKVEAYLYMMSESANNQSKLNLNASCIQKLIPIDLQTYTSALTYIDGSVPSNISDIERRRSLITQKSLSDITIQRGGFFEHELDYYIVERVAFDHFEHYSVSQFQNEVKACL